MKAFTGNKNSKFAWLALGLLALLLLSSCGGDEPTISNNLAGGSSYDYYVDAVSGDDTFDGSEATPFKTITHAMTVTLSAESVKVLPGLYDAALGEANPIVVPAGVTVIGDEANKGNGVPATKFSGVSFRPGDNAVIAGLMGDAASTNGFMLNAVTGVTIRNNTVRATTYGVLLQGGTANNIIRGNNLSYNSSHGIAATTTAGTGTRIEFNTITGNNYGIEFDSIAGDLGGGGTGSLGGNIISCNTTTDFWTNATGTVFMQNNYWDHGSPSYLTTAGGGIDTYSAGGTATLDTTGSMLAATTPCTYNYFVDAVSGDDTFDGSEATPFKTIMTALSVAISGNFVKIQPGLYDAANGETFPLMLSAGVTLIGDEANKGALTVVKGATNYVDISVPITLVAKGSNTVAGIKFEDIAGETLDNMMIALEGTGNVVRNNIFWGPGNYRGAGILIYNAASGGHKIVDNEFINKFLAGIYDVISGSESLVQGNLINGLNTYGVYIVSAGGLDMGGGGMGSTGGNTFTCSGTTDIFTTFSGTLFMQNNYWDHNPPTNTGTSIGGVDLYDSGVATLDTTGNMVATGACP